MWKNKGWKSTIVPFLLDFLALFWLCCTHALIFWNKLWQFSLCKILNILSILIAFKSFSVNFLCTTWRWFIRCVAWLWFTIYYLKMSLEDLSSLSSLYSVASYKLIKIFVSFICYHWLLVKYCLNSRWYL